MQVSRRLMIGVGAAVALAVGGTGVAVAIGGSGDGEQEGPPVAASVATKAGAAALKATGGGSVTEVERDSENGATYGVEVKLPDGSSVDVYLDNAFAPVGKPVADDAGTGDRGDGDGETNDD